MIDPEVEKVWQEFWAPIVVKDGVLDVEQVKKELFDFNNLMENSAVVYTHVTGNRVSKVNTCPKVVCQLADEQSQRELEEAEKEWTCSDCNERYRAQQDETRSKGEMCQEI